MIKAQTAFAGSQESWTGKESWTGTPVDLDEPEDRARSSWRVACAAAITPISGPDGKGTIYVVAQRSNGQWSFSTLKVAIHPTGELYDLME